MCNQDQLASQVHKEQLGLKGQQAPLARSVSLELQVRRATLATREPRGLRRQDAPVRLDQLEPRVPLDWWDLVGRPDLRVRVVHRDSREPLDPLVSRDHWASLVKLDLRDRQEVLDK